MVQGDVNPLLRRLAASTSRDISIATLEIEDVFLGYYEDAGADAAGPDARGGRPMIAAFRLELRRGRMLVLWVGLVSVLYAGVITALLPDDPRERRRSSRSSWSIYPKELMAAFGIEGSLGDPGTFINSYIFQFLWPLVAAIVAILLATRLGGGRRQRLPGPAAVDAAAPGPLPRRGDRRPGRRLARRWPPDDRRDLVVDLLIEPDFPTDRARPRRASTPSRLALAIAGVTTLLAVVFLDRGKAGGLAAGILIVMYLLNVLAAAVAGHGGLGRLSAFRYFDLKDLIDSGTYPLGDSLLYLAVASAAGSSPWSRSVGATSRPEPRSDL